MEFLPAARSSEQTWQQILIDSGFPVVVDHFGGDALSLVSLGNFDNPLAITTSSVGAFVGAFSD